MGYPMDGKCSKCHWKVKVDCTYVIKAYLFHDF